HERVGGVAVRDAQRDVALELRVEALAKLAAGDELSFAPGEWAVVHAERHAKGGLLDADGRKGPWIGSVGDGVADPRFDAGDRDDVDRRSLVHLHAGKTVEAEELCDVRRIDVTVMVAARDSVAL